MKKVLFFLSPLVLAGLVFFIFTYVISQQTLGKGALQVTSFPQSSVYLNDKLLGKTPLCKCEGQDMLPTGDYTIKLVPTDSTNVENFEEKISITKSVLTVVDRTFGLANTSQGSIINLSPIDDSKSAQLFITSFPTDATVTIDSNEAGQTPYLQKTITDSDHEVVVSKEGYKEKTLHIHTVLGYKLNAIIFLAIDPNAVASSSAFQQQASQSAQLTVAKVKILETPTGFLRVRESSSVASAEIEQVHPGDVFTLLSEQNGWYQIQLTDGKTGWISSQYAEKQ
ncbi:MAG: PEGA domain-containing protein [Candidatus Levyibacteriota bacterium]